MYVLLILAVSLMTVLVALAIIGAKAQKSARAAAPALQGKTLTIIVPAHNEERGLGETLASFLSQTVPADRIIVVADNCTDKTAEVALSYPGVDVLETPPGVGGSKAKAQNYGLTHVTTDLVLPVDADTTLDPDYIEKLKPVFDDPRVAIAAGCVLTKWHDDLPADSRTSKQFMRQVIKRGDSNGSFRSRWKQFWSREARTERAQHQNTVWEKGRLIEYLYGFTFHRPIQNSVHAPVVCSGCCSVFRLDKLMETRYNPYTKEDEIGFPERTIVEDMDYTWTQQIAGRRAVYVPSAVARAADPKTVQYMRAQMWRWMAGFFQNVRLHFWELVRHKPMLAFWVALAVIEIIMAPLWYVMPFAPMLFGLSYQGALLIFFGSEFVIGILPLMYGAWKRKIPFWRVLSAWPCLYANRVINITYAMKALFIELILVPLGIKKTFLTYEMGR